MKHCVNCYLVSSFYRPFLWGPAATSHHQTAKSLGPSLWQQPSVTEVLEQLDPSKLNQSTVFIFHRTGFCRFVWVLQVYVSCLYFQILGSFKQPRRRRRRQRERRKTIGLLNESNASARPFYIWCIFCRP